MFNQRIVESDAFTEMPATAQVLYFHLNMVADDDGFVNSPKKTARSVGCSDKDLNLLISKRFLISFPSGIVVIKHWLMHNTVRKDRYKPTEYQDEFAKLYIKPNKAYTENPEHAEKPEQDDSGIPNGNHLATETQERGNQLATQDRIGKDRLGKDRLNNRSGETKAEKRKDFTPPTLEEIKEFCAQRNSPVDPNRFYDFFEAGNWVDTKGNPVRNWKQKFITWERKEVERNGGNTAAGESIPAKVSGQTPRSRYGPSKYEYD